MDSSVIDGCNGVGDGYMGKNNLRYDTPIGPHAMVVDDNLIDYKYDSEVLRKIKKCISDEVVVGDDVLYVSRWKYLGGGRWVKRELIDQVAFE